MGIPNTLSIADLQRNNNTIIANEHTWLEPLAQTQLFETSTRPDMCCVVGMPDLHPGIDAPIGAAYLTQHRLYPALVGSDIGCGIALFSTELNHNKYSIDKLIKQLGDLESPLSQEWCPKIHQAQHALRLEKTNFDRSLGTIGGGNHFAEITSIDWLEENASATYALQPDRLHLLIHSGSRGLGHAIFMHYVDLAGHLGIGQTDEAFMKYFTAHQQALAFAALNRQLIAERMLKRLNTEGEMLLNIAHNFVEPLAEHFWLHRKGAAPADQGLVVIAGSRGSYSYLVEPQAQAKSLFSIAHGAGRKWKRSDCKGRLEKRYAHWRELERTKMGSRVICENKQLAYEEAPEAYKSIEQVIEALESHQLIKVVARLKPILTYKTREKS